MTKAYDREQLDRLVELVGAAIPALAGAYAAARLAPVNDWPLATAVLVAGGGLFVAAFTAIRCVPAEARHLALPDFEPAPIADDVLLLDPPLVGAVAGAASELLLDDPLSVPARDSRVVRLFAEGRMPTAGQLGHCIDPHIADRARPAAGTDASDSLSEALAELRRSLRHG